MLTDHENLGSASEPEEFEIERGAIRTFAEAIGDSNRAFCSGEIAPPTFPTTLHLSASQENGDPDARPDRRRLWLSGGDEFIYERPLRAGDKITCVRRIIDTYVKQGRHGRMTFVITETEGRDQEGNLVFRARNTLIKY